jgi:hypothetical protein
MQSDKRKANRNKQKESKKKKSERDKKNLECNGDDDSNNDEVM